jgi:hypothetical protein
MQGVLIYTAAGDSEGTLGGLVRAGEPSLLEPSIKQAIRNAGWCSSDPVCESVGQGSVQDDADHAVYFFDRGCLPKDYSPRKGDHVMYNVKTNVRSGRREAHLVQCVATPYRM